MKWQKLPAIEQSVSCLTCGAGARSDLKMEKIIAVGFGDAGYTRDGELIWSESQMGESAIDAENHFPDVAYVESLAKLQPDHDWRIYFHAALYDAEYQRQGDGVWVLVKKGEGFA